MATWPVFDHRTDRRVLDILHSGRLTAGEQVERFERSFAEWSGARHAFAVSNGTCALHAALLALGIGPGDEVICTSYSFIASSFAIMLAGAQPVFCDVGLDHIIDVSKAERLVNRRTRAIVVVHLFGIVADMDPILRFARRHGLKVIEDCAQCLGGVYRGRRVGTLGDAGCFSFCQAKHVTTGGEGGMVAVNDDALADRVRAVREFWHFTMTEMQAAIGLGEFARLDRWNLPRRRKLGRALIEGLRNHPLVMVSPPDTHERENSFWLVPFILRTELLDCSGFQFILDVQAEGVGAYAVLWPEMYTEGAYVLRRGLGPLNAPFDDPRSRRIDYAKVVCPVAKSLHASVIGFWAHPTYTMRDVAADIRAFDLVARRHMKLNLSTQGGRRKAAPERKNKK